MAKRKLFEAREKRVRPGRDEKILVSWNALAIRGMAHAGRVLGRPEWIASARRALGFIGAEMWREGRLLATCKDGRAHLKAYLDDYAFLLAAALELLQERFEPEGLAFACRLADVLLEQFEDADAGGFYFTARDHERLVQRPEAAARQRDAIGQRGGGLGPRASCDDHRRGAVRSRRRAAPWSSFYPQMRDYPCRLRRDGDALDEALQPPRTLILRGRGRGMRAWQAGARAGVPAGPDVLALPDGHARSGRACSTSPPARSLSTHGCAGALLVSRR
jgi:hypothetical protein